VIFPDVIAAAVAPLADPEVRDLDCDTALC
jgi:hypothetical protein